MQVGSVLVLSDWREIACGSFVTAEETPSELQLGSFLYLLYLFRPHSPDFSLLICRDCKNCSSEWWSAHWETMVVTIPFAKDTHPEELDIAEWLVIHAVRHPARRQQMGVTGAPHEMPKSDLYIFSQEVDSKALGTCCVGRGQLA